MLVFLLFLLHSGYDLKGQHKGGTLRLKVAQCTIYGFYHNVKINDKKEQRFGVVMTPLSSSK